RRFFKDEGIELLPTSPHSSYQNGAPERLGGIIMARARCLLRDSGIPHALWLEVVKTVTYLLNRTPNKQLKWASPLERAYQWLRANRPALYRHIQEDPSQNLAYLRIYGCRAYPLTTEAL